MPVLKSLSFGIPADFNLITSRTWRIASLSVGIQVPLRKAERRDRSGTRRGRVTPGDIKSERWARSLRNRGRHRAESALKKDFDAAKADYRVVEYPGAVHAFTNPEATELGKKFNLPLRYDAKADQEAKAEAAKFFAADLQK